MEIGVFHKISNTCIFVLSFSFVDHTNKSVYMVLTVTGKCFTVFFFTWLPCVSLSLFDTSGLTSESSDDDPYLLIISIVQAI